VSEGGRILVVDDDPGTSETLRDVLELEGHIVRTADCGRAGLETLAASPVEAAMGYIAKTYWPSRDRVIFLPSVKGGLRSTEIASLTWIMWPTQRPRFERARLVFPLTTANCRQGAIERHGG